MKRHQVLGFLLLGVLTSAFVPREDQPHRMPYHRPQIRVVNRELPSQLREGVPFSVDRHLSQGRLLRGEEAVVMGRRKCHSPSIVKPCEKKMGRVKMPLF